MESEGLESPASCLPHPLQSLPKCQSFPHRAGTWIHSYAGGGRLFLGEVNYPQVEATLDFCDLGESCASGIWARIEGMWSLYKK